MFKRKLLTVLVATAAVGFGGFAMNATAASVNGTANAVIYTPLSIVENTQMDFAGIAPSAAGGILILDTANSIGILPLGFVLSGTPASGQFTVTGEAGLTYGITFPGAPFTLNGSPGGTMTVDTFTVSGVGSPRTIGGGPPGAVPVSATDTFTVGANLNVGASQAAGTYTGTYTVQVDYQ